MFESSTQLRVRYAETDQMGVVYHANYAQYCEVGRAESIRSLGYTYRRMEEEGLLMPVVELNLKFIRPVTYDELITIKTQIREMPSGHKVVFNQEVLTERGDLACIATVTFYFLDAKTKAKAQPSQALLDVLQTYFKEG